LQKIEGADDLKISPLHEYGITYGTPTWIWNVVVNGDLCVRAYHGQKSSWYQAAQHQKRGCIHAAGMVKFVSFESIANKIINKLIDNGYRVKYKNNPYRGSLISEMARGATVKILPVEKLG